MSTSSSTAADIAAATNTSLAGVARYTLVNRNSELALEYVNGAWQLAAGRHTFGRGDRPARYAGKFGTCSRWSAEIALSWNSMIPSAIRALSQSRRTP